MERLIPPGVLNIMGLPERTRLSLDLTHTARLNTEHSSTVDRPLAFLVRIGRCHEPHQPDPLMVQLTNLGELSLGRGAEDALEPNGSAAAMRLADPSLSARHADSLPTISWISRNASPCG